MTPTEQLALTGIERLTWTLYAEQRFTLGGRREAKARRVFIADVTKAFDCIRSEAKRQGYAVDFGAVDLRLATLHAMQKPCCYCVDLFGLDAFAITFDVPPERDKRGYRMANIVVCCALCESCKGRELSGGEWLDVMAALKAADPDAARAFRVRLAAGTAAVDHRRGGQGTPRRVPAAGNARVAGKV
ncbi:hypothetical protein [Candidatus Korobacter versatilis]|nr:hypothetical protein [Candidatus Koribacter versatilis]